MQNADLLDLGSTSFPDYINARFREFNDWVKKHSELSKECIDALIECIYEIVKLQAVEEQVLINELRSHQASCCVIWDIRGLLLQGADDYLEKVEECCLQKANLSHEVSSYIKDVGQNFVYARSAILDRKIHNWRKDWSQMRRLRQTRVSSFLRRNDPVRMRNVGVTMAILPPNTGGSTKLNLDSASALPMHKLRAREMCRKKIEADDSCNISKPAKVISKDEVMELYRIIYSMEEIMSHISAMLRNNFYKYVRQHELNVICAMTSRLFVERNLTDDKTLAEKSTHLIVLDWIFDSLMGFYEQSFWWSGFMPIGDTCVMRSDQHLLVADKRRAMLYRADSEEDVFDPRWGNVLWVLSQVIAQRDFNKELAFLIEYFCGFIKDDKQVVDSQIKFARRVLGDLNAWKEAFRPLGTPCIEQVEDWDDVHEEEFADDRASCEKLAELPA